MKKLLFVIYGMGIGGVEKCLVNLVNHLDYKKYSITIAVMNPEYELLEQIDPSVKLIRFEDQFINTTDTMNQIWSSAKGPSVIAMLGRYVFYRVAVKLQLCPWKLQKWINDEYDYAIAYTHVGFVPNYVIDRTKAKKKILWYHTLFTEKKNAAYYQKFDRVVAVSQFCKENFIQSFPDLRDKVCVLYNFYNFSEILDKAKAEPADFKKHGCKVVTVGRLSPEKGFELAIRAAAVLKKKTCRDFQWYWIGDGPESCRVRAQQLIDKLGVNRSFHLLGNRLNPYPYIKQCDVYVQPSEREAFSTTIIEAKQLRKPIIVTDIGSVYEQVKDGENAFIVPHTPEELAEKIIVLCENDKIRESFKAHSMNGMDQIMHQNEFYDAFFD